MRTFQQYIEGRMFQPGDDERAAFAPVEKLAAQHQAEIDKLMAAGDHKGAIEAMMRHAQELKLLHAQQPKSTKY